MFFVVFPMHNKMYVLTVSFYYFFLIILSYLSYFNVVHELYEHASETLGEYIYIYME